MHSCGGASRLGFAAEEKKVGAVEDLMREHGVLRRVLLVYRETAAQLRAGPAKADPKPLHEAATLFRDFGEEYHEKKLEEAHLFPAIRKAGGPAASYIDVLIAQHNRGREITDYILAVTGKGAIGAAEAEPLARVFDAFTLMYENHAAREDTIVFPAWKQRSPSISSTRWARSSRKSSASNSARTGSTTRSQRSAKSSRRSASPTSPNSPPRPRPKPDRRACGHYLGAIQPPRRVSRATVGRGLPGSSWRARWRRSRRLCLALCSPGPELRRCRSLPSKYYTSCYTGAAGGGIRPIFLRAAAFPSPDLRR